MNNVDHGLLMFDQLIQNVCTEKYSKDIQCITSDMLDEIAYVVHDQCINLGILHSAARYAAMFSELKLRTLTLLNFMATYWFIRERVVLYAAKRDFKLDDTEMITQVNETTTLAAKIQTSSRG